jgi:quercetin dioxygenase-like cupin family protein
MRLENFPGLEIINLWATDDIPTIPVDESEPTIEMSSFLPSPGGTRFRIVRIAPADIHSIQADGMHSSDSTEYLVILSGEIWLHLDDGMELHLQPGDCVVQNGTRHAWHNRGSSTCAIAAVVVGAKLH